MPDPRRELAPRVPSFAALAALAALACNGAHPERPARSAPPPDDPVATLARAKAAMGFGRADRSVLHSHAAMAYAQAFQSDRSYPPYFASMTVEESWFDPTSGVARATLATTSPGNPLPPRIVATDAERAFALADGAATALPSDALASRYLDPWAVVSDWAAGGDVRAAGLETYRDYPRLVLVRATPSGAQRLFVDPKTGFPVKLERRIKHYLWGQRTVEYVYSNWTLAAGVMVAAASFAVADGETEVSRTVGEVELAARDTAPSLLLPALPVRAPDEPPGWLQPRDPTVVAVGHDTYLLTNTGYTEAVTRVGDDVFVFDATQGEERAAKDAAAIARLFPGARKVTLVVTDLAWPHIAGVRYWVANGATVVTHAAGCAFLRAVIERRWTLAPDLLERRRAVVKPTVVGVNAATVLAGGAVSLHPIDGISSEVALVAYVAGDGFLWASDYVQTVAEPSAYANEVVAAARRDGLHPARTAAQHLPVTPWWRVEALAGDAKLPAQ